MFLVKAIFFNTYLCSKDFKDFAKSVLYGTRCNIQNFGTFTDRQSLVVVQVHNLLFVLIESVHSLVQAPVQLAFGKIDKWAMIFIYTLLPPLVRAGLSAGSIFAQPIQVGIVGYSLKPGRKLAAACKTVK